MEFPITSRLSDFFSVNISKTYHVEVASKQNITVEILQLKRSMYEDPEGFVFKHFSVLINLLKYFKHHDYSLKMSALKVLLQVSEKFQLSLASYLEDEELDKEDMSKKRNMLKVTVFLLCQFANAFHQDEVKKAMDSVALKGRKKKANDELDCSEWPERRLKFLVIIKNLFKLPVYKLWDPPSVEPEFMNFVTITLFKLLETPEAAKDEGTRTEIFRFLGIVLKEYKTELVFSVKILQLVQDNEYLSSVMAEGVIYFVKECSADTLISDILKESTLVNMKVLSQKLSAAHSLSEFLVSVAEECPEKFLPHVAIILQFLEWEPHVMRNFSLSICGILISKPLCSPTLTAQEKNVRGELLSHVLAHLQDINSYVRCKAIQTLKMLQQEKSVASGELIEIGKSISKCLKDKASNVRKNAMSFMIDFVHENQLSCQVPFDVIKESYKAQLEKLAELQQNMPVIFEESDDESGAKSKPNGIEFEDSDDDETTEKLGEVDQNSNPPKGDSGNDGNNSDKVTSDALKKIEMDVQENDNSETAEKKLKKQKLLVNYVKSTLNFAQVIYGAIEQIRTLLHSSTQTDILEALEFIVSLKNTAINLSDNIMKEVLKLVRSKEASVRQAVLNTFEALYLSSGKKDCTFFQIATNLMELLSGATTDDALDIQECIKHFTQIKALPESLPNILWGTLTRPESELNVEQKISIVQLFGMLAEIQPEVLVKRLDDFIEFGLSKTFENSFLFTMYIFKSLGKVNTSMRGKIAAESVCEEIRLPHSSKLVSGLKHFLIDGIKNYSNDQWIPMANEAVATIFSLIEEPVMLCAEISQKLAEILSEDIHAEKNKNEPNDVTSKNISSILYSRFLAFCGHVAVHYLTFLKVDYYGYLRRQEAIRDRRRRRSSVHTLVPSIQSPNIMRIPKDKSSKKRKSKRVKREEYQLVPPMDEEATYEQIMEMCAKDVQDENKPVGVLLPIVIDACRWTLMEFNKEIQSAASLSLAKFMLLSEKVCGENMQLFATLAEKSPEPTVRANMIVAMGDLTTSYPNIVEPWTRQIFQRLDDSDSLVRENAVIILTHLILHDFVRIKSLISDVAKCIADPSPSVSIVAKYLFTELSKKGNAIYNILPDIISSLSDPNSGVNEEIFQEILGFILQYVEKEKLVEGLVEKLCCRFADSSTDIQFHELTFCLSILTLNAKCYRKLTEFKNLLKEKMSDPVVMNYIKSILAHAKKNDPKTAAELRAFKKELGL